MYYFCNALLPTLSICTSRIIPTRASLSISKWQLHEISLYAQNRIIIYCISVILCPHILFCVHVKKKKNHFLSECAIAAVYVYFMMDSLIECLNSAVKVCRFTHKQTTLQEDPSKQASGDAYTSTCPFLHQWICVYVRAEMVIVKNNNRNTTVMLLFVSYLKRQN